MIRRRRLTPLDQAVARLQTNHVPYRLDADKDTGVMSLYINGTTIPQVYGTDGEPVVSHPSQKKDAKTSAS